MKNVNVMMAVAAIAATAGCTCDRVCEPAKCPTPFPEWSAPRAITSGPHDHFFASYYGINSWSPDNRYVSVLETDLNGRLPDAGEECTLGLVDTQDGHRFIPVAKTSCWNFQEAAMAHWLPDEPDTLLYNDCRAGKFVTVILNWKTKRERIVPYPVSAVSPDGRWAVSINYARLSLTRPDYGYAGLGQDTRESVVWPEDDGLWLVNLKTGEAKLILSVAAARPFMPQTKDGKGLAYFCHTVFSKDGKRIFFLARSVDWFDKTARKASTWQTTSFTVSADGTNLRRCFKDDWAGSHFNWKDGETMLVTARWNGQKMWSHVEFTVGEEENVRHIGPGILDWDGHCLYSPDGRFMSSDGYWNGNFERTWVQVRLADGVIKPEGAFFVPEAYRQTYWRCDLHPRYRPDGKQIGFNSVHEGSRQVYVRDIQ